MAELSIEEARKIYTKSDELKALMLTKFSKEELDKVTQEEFDKTFLELLGKCIKTAFLDENGNLSGNLSNLPTNRIELQNADGEWMFDIQYTGKNKHFWVSYRVWSVFEDKYNLLDTDIERLMLNQLKLLFRLYDVTPTRTLPW